MTNITEDEDSEMTLPSMTALNQVRRINADDLVTLINSDAPPAIVDVRNHDEYVGEFGHIPGSIHIPLNELAERSSELDDFRVNQLILICRAGVRSTTGAAILTGLGFAKVCDLEGGMVDWNRKNLPVENAA